MTRQPLPPPRILQQRYESEIAPKIDAMRIDDVLRFRTEESPKPIWFYNRGRLNRATLACLHIEDDTVIVRLK
jgi:hypothetical protein